MKILFLFLLLTFILTSCKGQVKSNRPSNDAIERKTTSTTLPELNPPIDDPYFVETQDTFSKSGPQSITRNILQDKNGIFWFATWQGIMSYDGRIFTNYTLKDGLRKFHVFSLLEDKAGNLWFGTIGGGMYRYDGKTFTHYTMADGLADNDVLCMFQDKSGNIWFGTDGGVSRFDPSAPLVKGNITFSNVTTQDGLCGHSINSITQDRHGKIWFGTRYGEQNDVCCYDGNSFTPIFNKNGTRFFNVRSIINDKTGNIWIGGQDGLFRYNGSSITPMDTKFTGYIFEDKTGNLWLSEGETEGMALYRYDGKTFSKIASSGQVFGITEDRDGNIWFGTVNGVQRYDGKSFTNFPDVSKD